MPKVFTIHVATQIPSVVEIFCIDFRQSQTSQINSHLINFRGIHKPWRECSDFDLPELAGAQYPYDFYLAACEMFRTYISTDFLEKVRANAKRYSLINDWDREILAKSGPLKKKLAEFKEQLKNQ